MLDMNPVIRDTWTAELRSGKYAQGKTNLRKGDNYCCLGVLCELAVEAGVVESAKAAAVLDSTYYDDDEFLYGGALTMLPDEVMEWAGLKEAFPVVTSNGEWIDLSHLNDTGVPFEKIADYIDGKVDTAPVV